MSWVRLFAYLSVVLVALSFPVDGLPGIALAFAGVVAAVVSLRLNSRGGKDRMRR
jgi:hypothetical protein